jgi:hypothetical protein
MKRFIASLLIALLASPAYGYTRVQGKADVGSQTFITGLSGASAKATRVCPGASVTLYLAGTTVKPSTYSTSTGTAKANPTTSDSNGEWHFYVSGGTYDALVSGCGITRTIRGLEAGLDSESVSILDYGAVCDGTTDDTAAIQAALSVTGGHTVTGPAATCKFTDTLTINQNGVNFHGEGNRATTLLFVPSVAGKVAIKLVASNPAAVLYYNTLKNFRLYSTETTLKKTGIQLNDTSGTFIENVEIGPSNLWNGTTGGTSVGLQIRGRELGVVGPFICYTDGNPILISQNPNSASLDFDVMHFKDIYTGVVGTNNYHMVFEDGVDVTSFTMDGNNVFVLGGGGIYKNDTTSPFFNYSVNVSGLRWEQANNTGGWLMWWRDNTVVRGMTLKDLVTGSAQTQKGIHLENTENVTIMNFDYQGTGGVGAVELEMAGNNDSLLLLNNPSQQQSYKTMTNMTQVFAFGADVATPVAQQPIEYWVSTSNANRNLSYVVWGMKHFASSGTLADGASTTILDMGTYGATHAFVTVGGKGATKWQGGNAVAYGTVTVTQAGGSADFQVTPAAGKLSVSLSGANLILTNNLGESITYDYELKWR